MNAADRCDRCGAQAFVKVFVVTSGDLQFCAHHFAEHEDALREVAFVVADERAKINARPSLSSA